MSMAVIARSIAYELNFAHKHADNLSEHNCHAVIIAGTLNNESS